jgi:trimeric autotransporter adhesin
MISHRTFRLAVGVCLLACLPGGCSWLIPDLAPTAVITATPALGSAPLLVQLSGALSEDDGAIAEYLWEFSDEDGTATHGAQAERTYPHSGEYTVRLTVWDSAGQSDSAEIVIPVDNTAPIASLRLSNDAPAPRENVVFDASSSFDSDGHLTDYLWELGDGTTHSGTPVNHAYDLAGLYIVRLTVVDNAGASATVSHTMTVHETPSGGGCGGR